MESSKQTNANESSAGLAPQTMQNTTLEATKQQYCTVISI